MKKRLRTIRERGRKTDMENINDYLKRGGKITVGPSTDAFPLDKPRSRVWNAPKHGHDKEICKDCKNVGRCEDPCAPLVWIDGNVPLKEKILSRDLSNYDYGDYNVILAEKISSSREINGEVISGIQNIRKKAIVVLIDNGFTIKDISTFFKCSERTIYRTKEKQ